ncbi:glycerol-3-phosphate 1-O-acyltransferase PlsB [Oceanospirillum sediminis]|uniref:Glycerol-3-phosphate acyltransferase n=1 Tax=Oceanospirillum sediminis TaxID=2760088 RepID=A0A839IUI5_9GAMM|nr:glycerol-3-phosphate 1-O-acyltransferase PlsB [Oceanospirillum sediminis]MBB1488294.1 glycerol-3-phosphate 1-O-acyltransferase PlsB [Oceanospirillum sediminis]
MGLNTFASLRKLYEMMRPASSVQTRNSFSQKLRLFVFHILERLIMLLVRPDFHGIPPQDLPKQGETKAKRCYVLSGKSLSERLLLNCITRRYKLSRSEQPLIVGPDITTLKESGSFIALHRTHYGLGGLPRHTVSPRLIRIMAHLLEYPEQEVELVPVTVFWGRSPGHEQSGNRRLFSDQRGWLHQAICRVRDIVFHGRHTLVHFSESLSLREMIASSPENALLNLHVRKTARLLRVHFRQTRLGVLGPELQDRKLVIRQLVQTASVQAAIKQAMSEQNISTEKAQAKAVRYADEIVANVSFNAQKFFDRLLSWLWNRLYDGVTLHNIEAVQDAARHSTIVYVPCHRSHMDYLLLSYALFNNGLTPPHVAAGINLNMPVVGSLLRRGGAFFIRRSFRDNPLYATVFAEYLFLLLNKGYATEYFVEGGRSRTGRTLVPKPGMLSMTIRGCLRNPHRKIQLVPVYIGYEKVVEAGTYLGELQGKAKKSESLMDLVYSLKTLKQHFGKVSLSFGKPLEVNQMLQPFIDKHPRLLPEDRPDWLTQAVTDLSEQVATGINDAATLNGANLCALGLLASGRHTLEESTLKGFIALCLKLHNELGYSGHSPACHVSPDDLVAEAEKLELIQRLEHSYGDMLQLSDQQALLMTWYRNNILHLYALPSLIAFCFSHQQQCSEKELLSRIAQFYPMIRKELFLPWQEDELDSEVRRILDWMVQQTLLVRQEGMLSQNPAQQEKITLLKMLARPIQPTLERGYLMIALLLHHGSHHFTIQELEQESQTLAQRLSILHGLNAPEYFHSPLFQQLTEVLLNLGYIQCASDNKLTFNQTLIDLSQACRPLFDPAMRHSIQQLTHREKRTGTQI